MQMPSNLWTWVPFGQIMNGKYTGMYVSKITGTTYFTKINSSLSSNGLMIVLFCLPGVQVYQSEGGVRETFDPREMFNQQAPVSNNKTPTKSVGTPSRRTSPRKPKRINYGETGDSDKYDIASEDDGQPAYGRSTTYSLQL
jgi:hypothetical protein